MITQLYLNRRENLSCLISRHYGSQSRLGWKLKRYGLSQPTLSDILLAKRDLSRWEARKIESVLVLPDQWMDKKNEIKDGWDLIEIYQSQDEAGRRLFNQVSIFAGRHSVTDRNALFPVRPKLPIAA